MSNRDWLLIFLYIYTLLIFRVNMYIVPSLFQ